MAFLFGDELFHSETWPVCPPIAFDSRVTQVARNHLSGNARDLHHEFAAHAFLSIVTRIGTLLEWRLSQFVCFEHDYWLKIVRVR